MLKFRKRILLAKIETTEGTDPVPTGAANAILVHDLTIQPLVADLAQRDLVKAGYGADVGIHVNSHVAMTFDVELAGAGTAGTVPKYDALLRACGLSSTNSPGVSQTYAPISTAEESITFYFHIDGQKHATVGARGSLSIALNPGAIPRIKFTFVGRWVDPAAVADPTPVFTGWTQPIPVNKANTPTFTIHGAAAVMHSFEFTQGNQVEYKDVVNEESVRITDRNAAGTVTIDAPPLGTKNWFTIAKANTTGAFQFIHGTTAGNIIQFDASAAQPTQPNYSDMNGRAILQMGLQFTSAAVGDGDFSLVVK